MTRGGLASPAPADIAFKLIGFFSFFHLCFRVLDARFGYVPKGADLFGWSEPDYLDRVLAYARRSRVMDGLCSLDIPTRRWQTVPAP